MDSQNTSFLPPPIDGEASAPLAQPDDDFVVPLSAAGTPNTPATDGDTGSTVSPVSPIHLNRGPPPMLIMMDDNLLQNNGNAAADHGATDDGTGLLPPLDESAEGEQEKSEKDAAAGDGKNDQDENNDDDDDQVPVLAMSSILPATATAGDAAMTDDAKKATGTGAANGDNKSKDKSCFTTGNAAGGGADAEDSGTNNQQTALGCGTTLEYVVLITACTILLLAVTGTTVYWTMAYRGGYDSGWFPWPPQTPNELLSVGVFTYKRMHNLTVSNISTTAATTTTTAIATSVEPFKSNSSIVSIDERRFNLHPTLMTAGFVTLTGFSILVYRMAAGCPTSCRGTYVKLTHGLLHLITVPCVVLGSVAAMEYHRLKGLPHLYSLHSWMGFMTVSLFVIQFTLGFFTFVVLLCCRGATAVCRLRCFAPIHAALGLCTFTLAIGTCLTGLQQRADYTIFNNNGDGESIKEKIHVNKEPMVVNVLAVLLVFVLIIVSYTVRRESIKRRSNNRPSYTGTVSPMRIKSSSSTGKIGSGKQSSQLPI